MENYTVEIIETSRDGSANEFTKKERVMLKTKQGIKLDDVAPITIHPVDYAVLKIHNEKIKKNPDYEHYVLIDDSGEMYYTGSPSFFDGFKRIWSEMAGDPDWALDIYKRDSRNFEGKQFLTCDIS